MAVPQTRLAPTAQAESRVLDFPNEVLDRHAPEEARRVVALYVRGMHRKRATGAEDGAEGAVEDPPIVPIDHVQDIVEQDCRTAAAFQKTGHFGHG